MLAPFQSENMREIYRESMIVPCNWKVTAEAFLEVYHFKHIHSHDGVSLLDNAGAAMGLYRNGHSRMITPYSRQVIEKSGMAGWDDWKYIDQGPFAVVDGVSPMIDCTSSAVSLFPNAIIPLGRFGFPINFFWPIDKNTTRLDWVYYGIKDWEGDELPEHWQLRRQTYNQIMGEDEMNMAPIQESMESPALTGIPINYQERRIWHFHEEIDRRIGQENVPEALRIDQLLEDHLE